MHRRAGNNSDFRVGGDMKNGLRIRGYYNVSVLSVLRSALSAAFLYMCSTGAAVSQEEYDTRTRNLLEALKQIESTSKITPEDQHRLEKAEPIEPEVIKEVSKRLTAVGLGPIEYCCHNNGKCDCNGRWDCTL